MTSRAIFAGLFKRGKQVVLNVVKQKTQKAAQVKVVHCKVDQVAVKTQSSRFDKLLDVWRTFIPTVYYKSVASQLSRKAAWDGRRNVFLLSFVGLVAAQAQSDDEDEFHQRINDFIKATDSFSSPLMQKIRELSLEHFEFGSLMGHGCDAAVFEARLVQNQENSYSEESEASDTCSQADSDITLLTSTTDCEGDEMAPTEYEVHSENMDISSFDSVSDVDDAAVGEGGAPTEFTVEDSDDESDFVVLADTESVAEMPRHGSCESPIRRSVSSILGQIRSVEHADENAVYDTGENDQYMSVDSHMWDDVQGKESSTKFDLAVKIMFNYGVESNADAILREMERETVPAQTWVTQPDGGRWENGNRTRKKRLPPHPNIVEMWGVFVDPVPRLHALLDNFPAALPERINPGGFGRNMTMFLVMKRYECTLKEYLTVVHLSLQEQQLLLLQLLEAVDHMSTNGISHRDMKSDNILLDTAATVSPRLVLSDFGCCLADAENGLQLPFTSDYINRGGNTALMAPEIITAQPGKHAVLDYTKADTWAVGALAYEIFGLDNPFYSNSTGRKLSSATYSEADLPPLPTCIPALIRNLVAALLSRDPTKRPSARKVADILHVLLWAPEDWKLPGKQVDLSEVNWWCITMATLYHLETSFRFPATTESTMKRLFLQRFNTNAFIDALDSVQLYN